jgi:hypothetical protein
LESGWGVTRAELAAQGIRLPRPGSFKDRILQEHAYQVRTQRYFELSLFTHLIANGLGLNTKAVNEILVFIEEVLNRKAFQPGRMEEFIQKIVVNSSWTKEAEKKALEEVANFG